MIDPIALTPAQLAAFLDASRTAIVAEMGALGHQAAERLIAPMMLGIFAGDARLKARVEKGYW